MLLFGYGRWDEIRVDARLRNRSSEDVAAVGRAIIAVMLQTEAMSMAQVRCCSMFRLGWSARGTMGNIRYCTFPRYTRAQEEYDRGMGRRGTVSGRVNMSTSRAMFYPVFQFLPVLLGRNWIEAEGCICSQRRGAGDGELKMQTLSRVLHGGSLKI